MRLATWALWAALAMPAGAETVTRQSLLPGTPYQTELTVKAAATPAPTVFVIGGCHGDEPAGYLAAEKLLAWQVTRGTLVVLPRAHMAAIKRGVRAYPGNMNRMFPGKASGTAMERLADAIWQQLKAQRPDLLVTLHESVQFHRVDPSAYGQTLTHDFAALNARFQPALTQANAQIANPRHRFSIYVRAFPTCPTYCAYKYLGVPSTSIETCRKLPLATRIAYQLVMLRALLRQAGLEWEEPAAPGS